MRLAAFRLFNLPSDGFGESDQGEITRVAHDRNNEAIVVEVDGDAQIDDARQPERLALEAGVDLRESGDRETSRARDERQISERDAVRLLDRLLVHSAQAIDRGKIDIDRLEHVRNRPPVFGEPLPGPLSHCVQRDDVAVLNGRRQRRWRRGDRGRRRSLRRGTRLDRRAHGRLVDLVRAASLGFRYELCEVDPMLRNQPTSQRRQADAVRPLRRPEFFGRRRHLLKGRERRRRFRCRDIDLCPGLRRCAFADDRDHFSDLGSHPGSDP